MFLYVCATAQGPVTIHLLKTVHGRSVVGHERAQSKGCVHMKDASKRCKQSGRPHFRFIPLDLLSLLRRNPYQLRARVVGQLVIRYLLKEGVRCQVGALQARQRQRRPLVQPVPSVGCWTGSQQTAVCGSPRTHHPVPQLLNVGDGVENCPNLQAGARGSGGHSGHDLCSLRYTQTSRAASVHCTSST